LNPLYILKVSSNQNVLPGDRTQYHNDGEESGFNKNL
jgi:hypothetical protein